MKLNDKIFTAAMVLFVAISVLLACAIHADAHNNGTHYALTCEVVEVDREADTVTCEDSNGNLWEFYGCEDWHFGKSSRLLACSFRVIIVHVLV